MSATPPQGMEIQFFDDLKQNLQTVQNPEGKFSLTTPDFCRVADTNARVRAESRIKEMRDQDVVS